MIIIIVILLFIIACSVAPDLIGAIVAFIGAAICFAVVAVIIIGFFIVVSQ